MNTFYFFINKKIIFFIFVITIFIVEKKSKSINKENYSIEKDSIYKVNNNSNCQPLKKNKSNKKKISNKINKLNNATLKKINDIKIKRKLFINPYYKDELKFYETFLKLKKMPNNLNDSIIEKEKNDIFSKISENVGMDITSLDEVYFNTEFRFGNELIIINKLIFFCEIIGVKKIIINKDNNLYLNHTIHDQKFNLTIEINNEVNNNNIINDNNYNDNNINNNDNINDNNINDNNINDNNINDINNNDNINDNNINDNNINDNNNNDNNNENNFIDYHNFNPGDIDSPLYNSENSHTNYFPNIFYWFFNLRIENRLDVIKNEILKNLPKVKVSNKDLYIHIRGGDVFQKEATNRDYCPSYAQYPLCFYNKIIDYYKFKKIFIISEDKLNPVVNKLLNKYSNVIYQNNTLEKDISYLAHAYNIVGSVSSFITSIIKLNDNLRYFWEYDIYQMEHKLYHLHHSLYDYPRKYTIFRMEPSERYKKDMYKWVRSKYQINIMLNEKCQNNFTIISPNI